MRLSLQPVEKFYVPNDPDQAYVTVELLTLEQRAAIDAKSSDTSVDETGVAKISIDQFSRTKATAKQCLKGWGNFHDATGAVIKYSKANMRHMSSFTITTDDGEKLRFVQWVDNCHSSMIEQHEIDIEDASKN